MRSLTDVKCRKLFEFVFKSHFFYGLIECDPVIVFKFSARTELKFQGRVINFQLYCHASIFWQGGIPLKCNSISGISQCLLQ